MPWRWLFRARCPACRAWAEPVGLCAGCDLAWPPPPAGPVPAGLDGLVVGGTHAGAARAVVRACKYLGQRRACAVLAHRLLQASGWPSGAWRVVPVPLHPRRRWRRGFNQSERLARLVSRASGWPVQRALRRLRDTPPLHGLSPRDRAEAVAGAFSCAGQVGGAQVLLVDDVLTTGATAVACADVLRAAGAKRVWLAVATRAPCPELRGRES